MAAEFHDRHGKLIFLSNGNRTARRRNPGAEFNNGLVFSKQCLGQAEMFEIRIDRKIGNWSGSMAIGVTTANPSNIEIPSSATGLKNGYWIMSGISVLKDGTSMLDNYGKDLDELDEGDRIGVRRTSDGCLHFYVNGSDLGVAARSVPSNLYAVVDLYGKCVEVSIYNPFQGTNGVVQPQPALSTASVAFHPHCGSLVRLCNHSRTAERQRADEEFKNSVVLTNQPLEDDTLFEVKVEKLTDMWAGSLEVGVTSHDPLHIVFPPTMTSMPSGTWMWSGTSIIIDGQEVKKDYSDVSLETIKVGDKVGMLRKSDGNLSFFLNGVCLGVAVGSVPPGVHGVVDLYGAAVRVSICGDNQPCDSDMDIDQAAAATLVSSMSVTCHQTTSTVDEPLLFHTHCGTAVCLTNENRTAFRPRALEEFNNAVVLTNRPLKPGELFEVHVDRQLDKWAGSLEIGVTTHTPDTLEFPSTMTNVMTGTWIMSGGGMMCNGATIIEEYGHNLDELKDGDRVGLIYSEDGSLHFYVNGTDMGLAAKDVPRNVYGVIDLYGMSAQATITNGQPRVEIPQANTSMVTSSPSVTENPQSQASQAPQAPVANENWFTFSDRHGDQVAVSHDCRNAIRINPLVEFNNAVVMSHRPLRDDEMFEVIINKLVDRWSGSLEAGVTTIAPDQLGFPNTMTDLDHDTWMLSGSSVLQDGATIQNGYACDLDKLEEGYRLGIMRKPDGCVHFFVNGKDCGSAVTSVPAGVYAIIDLYGRCVQLSVYDEDYVGEQHIPQPQAESQPTAQEEEKDTTCLPRGFHPCCGRNISLINNRWTAIRKKGFNNGLLFSSKPLQDDEIFEIKVDKVGSEWSGSLGVGVTSCLLPMFNVPSTADELRDGTWVMVESRILKDGVTVKENYGSSLDRLQMGTRIGVQRRRDGTLHIYFNGEDQGVAATDVPRMVFTLVDLYGVVEGVSVVSETDTSASSPRSNIESEQRQELDKTLEKEELVTTVETRFFFSRHCGQHIRLDNKRTSARRVASYNHGVVLSDSPLPDSCLFQVRITKLDSSWSGSLMIGITDQDPDSLSLASTANCMKLCPWIIVNNTVYINGNKVYEGLQQGLDALHVGDTVGVMIDRESRLHVFTNGQDQGVVAEALPARRHVVIDVYGCCQEVCITTAVDEEHHMHVLEEEEKAARVMEEHSKGPCDYRQLCDRFKTSLAIPDGYFNQESKLNVCYCQACHEARGEKLYEASGDPPRRYALPLGWCQFGLGLPPRIESLQVFQKWHVAYYGTQIGRIRRILDLGDLPMLESSRRRRGSKTNSNKENEMPQLVISPTVMCVTCRAQATPHQYRDVPTGEVCSAQVAFRVRVKPGSYSTGQSSCCSHGSNEALSDHNLDTQDLEWYLKDKGMLLLTALLIKIDPT